MSNRPSRVPLTIASVVAVAATACLAGTVISASPAEAPGVTAGYFEASHGPAQPYRPEVDPRAVRSGTRKPLAPSKEPIAKPSAKPTASQRAKAPQDIRISQYVDCTGRAQPCIDAGDLTLYNTGATPILAGHDHMGYAWLARVPVGTTVRVISGGMAGTYVATAHMSLTYRGNGSRLTPDFRAGTALVLQTCIGTTGTGFTLLRRADSN